MPGVIRTLWDLLGLGEGAPVPTPPPLPPNRAKKERTKEPSSVPAPKPASRARVAAKPAKAKESGTRKRGTGRGDARRAGPMKARYEAMTETMLRQYGVRVRRWRTNMSGVAWEVRYRDGSVKRLIEAPEPRGPMSAAVFLHEIGHHAIGFDVYKPRCREEYYAWKFAIEQMEAHGLNVTDAVRDRMRRSLRYAVGKARRRGLKVIPEELLPYASPQSLRGYDVGAKRKRAG